MWISDVMNGLGPYRDVGAMALWTGALLAIVVWYGWRHRPVLKADASKRMSFLGLCALAVAFLFVTGWFAAADYVRHADCVETATRAGPSHVAGGQAPEELCRN